VGRNRRNKKKNAKPSRKVERERGKIRSPSKTVSNQKIRNAQALQVNGITFRSKLEAFTYQKLLDNGINDFKYEEEKFTLLEAFDYPHESYEAYERTDRETKIKVKQFGDVSHNIRSMTYLPDFTCIDHDTKKGWIIEVKGYANDAWPLKWKIFKHYLEGNGYDLTLCVPNTQGNVLKCIEIIKNKYYGKI
jgi:hypothetical protein